MEDDPVTLPVEVDLAAFNTAMAQMQRSTISFGNVFGRTMLKSARQGNGLRETLRNLALDMSRMALRSSLKPLEQATGAVFGQIANGLSGGIRSGLGSLVSAGQLTPFAKGGVVSGPAMFGAPGRMGLMGEAGPEAILPLARGPDGRLGVSGNGAGQGAQITFNVSTPDAASFQKSRGEITAMLARAVQRGRRGL